MSDHTYSNLSQEDLIELLVLSTQELMSAIDKKAGKEEIYAKRKALQQIQQLIMERKQNVG